MLEIINKSYPSILKQIEPLLQRPARDLVSISDQNIPSQLEVQATLSDRTVLPDVPMLSADAGDLSSVHEQSVVAMEQLELLRGDAETEVEQTLIGAIEVNIAKINYEFIELPEYYFDKKTQNPELKRQAEQYKSTMEEIKTVETDEEKTVSTIPRGSAHQ